jgi:signal transduction histidine kinase
VKHNHNTSIFFQIALLVFSAIIIIIIIIFGAGSVILHHNMPRDPDKSFLRYIDGVPGEIGIPPERKKIKEVAEEYGLLIIYMGPEFEYATEKYFSITSLPMDTRKNDETGIKGRYIYAVKKIGEHTFVIASSLFGRRRLINAFLIFAILFLIFLLLIVHQVIRRILSPIKYLMTGVNKVKQGDFSYTVPVKKHDELGRLSRSFNSMTGMIKKMIKAKEQLLLDVSHELRSPLTRMKVTIEFITDQKIKKSLHEDMREMEVMIREILETERIDQAAESINFIEVDIVSLVRDTADSCSEAAKGLTNHRHFQITLEIPHMRIPVKGNPTRLKILFRNIIENALRYSENKPIHITIKDEEHMVRIIVADRGRGIPAESLPFIFEPFYRTDSSRSRETGGYGLGMYLCKKIVDLHNGEIHISSTPGKGTSVQVELPH